MSLLSLLNSLSNSLENLSQVEPEVIIDNIKSTMLQIAEFQTSEEVLQTPSTELKEKFSATIEETVKFLYEYNKNEEVVAVITLALQFPSLLSENYKVWCYYNILDLQLKPDNFNLTAVKATLSIIDSLTDSFTFDMQQNELCKLLIKRIDERLQHQDLKDYTIIDCDYECDKQLILNKVAIKLTNPTNLFEYATRFAKLTQAQAVIANFECSAEFEAVMHSYQKINLSFDSNQANSSLELRKILSETIEIFDYDNVRTYEIVELIYLKIKNLVDPANELEHALILTEITKVQAKQGESKFHQIIQNLNNFQITFDDAKESLCEKIIEGLEFIGDYFFEKQHWDVAALAYGKAYSCDNPDNIIFKTYFLSKILLCQLNQNSPSTLLEAKLTLMRLENDNSSIPSARRITTTNLLRSLVEASVIFKKNLELSAAEKCYLIAYNSCDSSNFPDKADFLLNILSLQIEQEHWVTVNENLELILEKTNLTIVNFVWSDMVLGKLLDYLTLNVSKLENWIVLAKTFNFENLLNVTLIASTLFNRSVPTRLLHLQSILNNFTPLFNINAVSDHLRCLPDAIQGKIFNTCLGGDFLKADTQTPRSYLIEYEQKVWS